MTSQERRMSEKTKPKKLRTWKFDAWTLRTTYRRKAFISLYQIGYQDDIPVSVVVTELPRKKK
jgi:hypothetical protein